MNYNLNFVNLPVQGGLDIAGVSAAYYLEIEKVTNIEIKNDEVTAITRVDDEKYKSLENRKRFNSAGKYSMLVKDANDLYWLLRDCDFELKSGVLTINEYSTVLPTKLYAMLPYIVIEQ